MYPLHLVRVISDHCPRLFGPSDMVIIATKLHAGSESSSYDYPVYPWWHWKWLHHPISMEVWLGWEKLGKKKKKTSLKTLELLYILRRTLKFLKFSISPHKLQFDAMYPHPSDFKCKKLIKWPLYYWFFIKFQIYF